MSIQDEEQRLRRLVELNVIEQVRNLAKTNIVQNALQNGVELHLHGLVYDLREGLLKDLNVDTDILQKYQHIYAIQETPEAAEGSHTAPEGTEAPETE